MSKYRVTHLTESTSVVEAENPFMAAVTVGGTVVDVRPARGPNHQSKAPVKKRKFSAQARAAMVKNAANARAAKARKSAKKK